MSCNSGGVWDKRVLTHFTHSFPWRRERESPPATPIRVLWRPGRGPRPYNDAVGAQRPMNHDQVTRPCGPTISTRNAGGRLKRVELWAYSDHERWIQPTMIAGISPNIMTSAIIWYGNKVMHLSVTFLDICLEAPCGWDADREAELPWKWCQCA